MTHPETPAAILAIDQGTTSSRAIVFSPSGEVLFQAQQDFTQHFPQTGWVEHDPTEIWQVTLKVCQDAIAQASQAGIVIKALGITNQRETTVVWNKSTGEPIYPAIVWQDKRTAEWCAQHGQHNKTVTHKTGLRIDPYFSATKIHWILNNVDGAKTQAEAGELAFGTIDSFLIWHLTAGKVHATDTTNASRTLLFNIRDMAWDNALLALFDVPETMLPKVKESADDYGVTAAGLLPYPIPICGVAGDQQAALIGQCCFEKGMMKSTYGTGCFALANTGTDIVYSQNQLLTTVGYTINGETHYALEGSIFIAGAAIQWCRDGIGILNDAKESEGFARTLDDEHGVVMVPAFAGLGAPYWDSEAKGSVFGLTRGTTQAHLIRAALESVCYQTHDLMAAMAADGIPVEQLAVDGGMVANQWFCQFLANLLGLPVTRPFVKETTALGASYLAGLYAGLISDTTSLKQQNPVQTQYDPKCEASVRQSQIERWQRAVAATRLFSQQ